MGNILNTPEFICLHTAKWFQEFLSNMNNSIIIDESFVCTQLKGFKYFYRTLIILFDITNLFHIVSSFAM